MSLHEELSCYASSSQRSILKQLTNNPDVCDNFFLTGGTALSVFYLHHRTSDDLDLFTVNTGVKLDEISFWLKTELEQEQIIIRSSPKFLSLLIDEVKVDFVIDPLSIKEERKRVTINSNSLMIDTLSNIVTNKLCTVVSRNEPKDYIDFYFLNKDIAEQEFDSIFYAARKKEALFDDPPTAAYQIEEGLRFIRGNTNLIPKLRVDFKLEDMVEFYNRIAKLIYGYT